MPTLLNVPKKDLDFLPRIPPNRAFLSHALVKMDT